MQAGQIDVLQHDRLVDVLLLRLANGDGLPDLEAQLPFSKVVFLELATLLAAA